MGDTHALTVRVLTWFLLVTSILGVGARGLTKAVIVRSISLDDYLITVSLVRSRSSPSWFYSYSANGKQLFAIGQSIAISVEAGHGYGSPSVPLSRSQVTANLKACLSQMHGTESFD